MSIDSIVATALSLAYIVNGTRSVSAINLSELPESSIMTTLSSGGGHELSTNDAESSVDPIATIALTDNPAIPSDARGITAHQARLMSYVAVPLNMLSLMLSLCVVAAYLFARHYRPTYANRVSLRLTVLLAAVDAFY